MKMSLNQYEEILARFSVIRKNFINLSEYSYTYLDTCMKNYLVSKSLLIHLIIRILRELGISCSEELPDIDLKQDVLETFIDISDDIEVCFFHLMKAVGWDIMEFYYVDQPTEFYEINDLETCLKRDFEFIWKDICESGVEEIHCIQFKHPLLSELLNAYDALELHDEIVEDLRQMTEILLDNADGWMTSSWNENGEYVSICFLYNAGSLSEDQSVHNFSFLNILATVLLQAKLEMLMELFF